MKQALLGGVAALCLLSVGAPAAAAGMDDLVAAAKKEGALTVIALPRDWCGYGALIDSFKTNWVSPSLPLRDVVRLPGGHHSTPGRWT